ncbi:hypothetical protein KGF56_002118 [Candida oxycetoniae]|uniref:M7GpppX diphosphatase n=1 Tax=Candida oxycetoniae TaxID=497107 RepID=A0AAI9SXY5_9ASCO|nr:uncharacterized protein KGF56_002118 [Candida oxycetoniae]KAI3405162.2 hypothetical protein KGF56_002118 [Candida oxycetoniae]
MSRIELLEDFKFSCLLNSDTQTKTIAVLGTIKQDRAIIVIEKTPFNVDLFTKDGGGGSSSSNDDNPISILLKDLREINSNDVYTWAKATLKQNLSDLPGAKFNLIYPATETHIEKYTSQKLHYVRETSEMYYKYVVPYIETMKGDRMQWVYNILFHEKEKETVIYHDKSENGFVLLPDMKWDGVNLQNMYLCCIVNRRDIASIRDLKGEHTNYLKRIREKIEQVTKTNYGLTRDKIRIFVHYQPSYYHFHLHVVNVEHPGLGNGINIGKAIFLDDVIDNLRLNEHYYQEKTIGYILGESHALWKTDGYRNLVLNTRH